MELIQDHRLRALVMKLWVLSQTSTDAQIIRGHFPMDAVSALDRASLPKRYQYTGSPFALVTHQHPLANSMLYLQ